MPGRDIKVQPKAANIAGLQLADVLAHPVKLACLAKKDRIPGLEAAFGIKRVLEDFKSGGDVKEVLELVKNQNEY